jgi:parallel beta-helix repeat protein
MDRGAFETRMKKIVILLFVILILGALTSFYNVGFTDARVVLTSRIILVPGDFATIQGAINNATSGDTVLVSNGTYKEQVIINKPIDVIGQNRSNTIIDAGGAGYVVQIKSSNATLSGFTLQNTSRDLSIAWGGIWLNGFPTPVSNVTIANCTVTNSLYAIWFNNAMNNTLSQNDFVSNSYDFGFLSGATPAHLVQDIDTSNKVNGKPIYWLIKQHNQTINTHTNAGMVAAINCTGITVKDLALEHNGCSVLFVNTNSSVVQNVTVSNSDVGVNLLYSSNNTVRDNTVSNCSHYGIALTYSNSNIISNNDALLCSWNIKVVSSRENRIVANTITNSTDIDGDGMMLDRDSIYNLISDNVIRFNIRAGIALDDESDWNVLTGNLFEFNQGSTGGLELCDGSNGNLITENTFRQNLYGITSTSSDNASLHVSNLIFKNNFLNNTVQVSNKANPYNLYSTWDNGAEGNYWSDAVSADVNKDGINDDVYQIDANNTDRYPLSELWSRNRTFAVNGTPFSVSMISNSTIGGFEFNPTVPLPYIAFNVTGPSGAMGSCNVTIPKLLLNVTVSPDEWVVTVDGNLITPVIGENATHTFFYLTYNFTTHYIRIVGTNAYPEFPIQTILLLTLFFATLGVAVLRRKVH